MKKLYAMASFLMMCASAAELSDNCNDPDSHSSETLKTARLTCGPSFNDSCLCMRTRYENRCQFVVNCTDSGFRDATPLSRLPNETQVLIFTGNHLEELPWNVFGTLDDLPHLRVIDMSNNKIREIRGKAYHHVRRVERLVLDFNELSLDPARRHPRVFSNFASLLELHLTDAFEDGPPRDLAETLHDIFVNSNLTRLTKLHLEQNEISEFRDGDVFCDLPALLDLYLGDNALTAFHFNVSCLRRLRFLDLQRNKFARLAERDLRAMDALVERNQNVSLDLTGNPLECTCGLNPFVEWMNKTRVFIRNKDNLKCSEGGNKPHGIHETKNCTPRSLSSSPRTAIVLLFFLTAALIALVCALIYVQRAKLQKKIEPILDSVNKRVRYTSIATGDNREDV